MEKKYVILYTKAVQLNNEVKDAICDHMKELRHIEFNTLRDFPFMDCVGDFYSVEVKALKYIEGDVSAISVTGREWSIQEEGTIDGCLELLFYLEEDAYKIVKEE